MLELNDKIVEKVNKITTTDYSGLLQDFEIEQLIEDLVYEIETKEQEIKEIKKDIEDNYKPLSSEELYG